MGLYSADGTHDHDRPIEHPKRAFNFGGKVDVTGRVDDVDLMVLPVAGNRGTCYRNSPILFLFHPVHDRFTVIDFADAVTLSGVVEDSFSSSCLAGIDVSHDADVSG